MKWCQRCVLPDTRPNLELDKEGVCNACRMHGSKPQIPWQARSEELRDVVAHAKASGARYDCVIPVSGGKDSTWQTIKCLELGLRPLAVTWRPPGRTPIGQRNLDNLRNLGVDHVDFSINPAIERTFMKKTLIEAGSPSIPMHLAIFAIPPSLAVAFGIPLVVWGENSAFEYGHASDSHVGAQLTGDWLRSYGVTGGTSAQDWVGPDLPPELMGAYLGPSERELQDHSLRAVFLGYYLQWDPKMTAEEAMRHGFRADDDGPRTGVYDFADIDDEFISIHHWMKWFKFGFTRTFDNLSIEIRNGRLTREEALAYVRLHGISEPTRDIVSLCGYLGMTRHEFDSVCDSWRNLDIWEKGPDGRWHLPDFLIPGVSLP